MPTPASKAQESTAASQRPAAAQHTQKKAGCHLQRQLPSIVCQDPESNLQVGTGS